MSEAQQRLGGTSECRGEWIAWLVAPQSPTKDTGFCVWAMPCAFDPERMIATLDYQRALADCATKRRIVDAFRASTLSARRPRC